MNDKKIKQSAFPYPLPLSDYEAMLIGGDGPWPPKPSTRHRGAGEGE